MLDDLVEGMKKKDTLALEQVMRLYGDVLLRTAYLLLKDRQAAEEAVQDTFVQAFYKIEQLQDSSKIKSWLLRITVNRCRMKQRAWSWNRLLPSVHVERLQEEASAGAEERYFERWDQARVGEAMQQLEYKYREAMVLYYYNDMQIADIAEQLNCKENTVKSRLMRGRQRLKALLRGRGIGDDQRS